jgi:hypothetical protein
MRVFGAFKFPVDSLSCCGSIASFIHELQALRWRGRVVVL